MATWIVTCPNCGTSNRAPRESIVIRCGTMSCTCVCTNCGGEFDAEEEYWRWLGLASDPQDERGKTRA